MHLKSVSERAKGLATISHGFSSSLAQIIATVMEQFKADVVAGSDHGKVSKSDTHSIIAKKIRDTQRKFQSALLGYIKLIEILAALSPDMLPALRDAYAEMVSEGILMKKRMKGYFQALPARNAAHLNRAGKELKEYVPFIDPPAKLEGVNAPDIRAVLSELLPVIAREAYFTSALFGSNKKELDGREKKRNFENAKNAVDLASANFRYYVNRTCGIVEAEASRAVDLSKVDPMLCLVATIYLNEAMDNYIDREKKGGDHSLSLAYVRATILDLRKKADKQWVAWVEKQIEWIKTHEGVPPTGKRAGVFSSFARFPKYLDHLIQCCSEGRDQDYVPDLAGIKVINYYLQKIAVNLLESLKECANRDSTEKTYATNVMKMENTYFFTQCIKQRGEVMSKLFSKQVMKANAMCKESTDAYLGWMIKREFTALHELFSRVSKARKEHGDREVIKHVPKDQFVKILQKEASREVLKEKIGAMFSRMEKHLSEEGGLLIVAWKALVKVLYEWFGRWEKLCTSIYQYKIDPSAVDVVRIAKAAGGGGGTSAAGGSNSNAGTIAGGGGSTLNNSDGANMTSMSAGGVSGMDDPHQLGEFAFKSILALGSGGTAGGQAK
jgi:Exocyst complex component Sec3